MYNQQLKKLNDYPSGERRVIKSKKELQDLGHAKFVSNSPDYLQKVPKNSPIQSFIPWQVVWKDISITTHCRLVFDASKITDTGYRLNDIISKGRNNIYKLLEIVIR